MPETTFTAAVITVSDKGFRGEREDTSGPAINILIKLLSIISIVFAYIIMNYHILHL